MRYVFVVIAVFLLYSCTPPPGPIPPMFSGPAIMGLGWIILGVIALFAVFVILKNNYDKKPKDNDNIVKALNDINERLKRLEEDVKQLKKRTKK